MSLPFPQLPGLDMWPSPSIPASLFSPYCHHLPFPGHSIFVAALAGSPSSMTEAQVLIIFCLDFENSLLDSDLTSPILSCPSPPTPDCAISVNLLQAELTPQTTCLQLCIALCSIPVTQSGHHFLWFSLLLPQPNQLLPQTNSLFSSPLTFKKIFIFFRFLLPF